MEGIFPLIGKFIEITLEKSGFGAVVLFIMACLFVYLYFMEKRKNTQLTKELLEWQERSTDRYVDVISEGIKSDGHLSQALNELTHTISDIKHKVDNLVVERRNGGDHSPGRR